MCPLQVELRRMCIERLFGHRKCHMNKLLPTTAICSSLFTGQGRQAVSKGGRTRFLTPIQAQGVVERAAAPVHVDAAAPRREAVKGPGGRPRAVDLAGNRPGHGRDVEAREVLQKACAARAARHVWSDPLVMVVRSGDWTPGCERYEQATSVRPLKC